MNKKTVVITGGNRGIGYDITEIFVNAGYEVFVGARTDCDIESSLGGNVHFIPTDVCIESNHQQLVDEAIKSTGRLDTYINNAGFSEWRSIANIDNEFLDKILSTNLKSVFWGCKAALSVMSAGANIINISSIAGKRGSSNNSAYCASKFGVNAITQSLAKEVGKNNIRVNAVCPVIVPTEGLVEALGEAESPAAGQDVNIFIDNFRNSQAALPDLPSGEQVAQACLYLASEQASAITGQCINVDCGVFPQ